MTRGGEDAAVPTFSRERTRAAVGRARLRTVFSGRRGSAQLGLLVAAAAVAGGMTIGSGVASHSTRTGYDLAWLADGKRGQVVQVDPALGKSNVRLQVASPGDPLDIQQGNGQLVIVNRQSGKISSIDLGTLLVGGSRQDSAGSSVKVLLGSGRMYVADLAKGTVQAVDPSNEANIGTPWNAGGPLVDVGIDGQQHVWALGSNQKLTSLVWQNGPQQLTPSGSQSVPGTGAGSVIVGHPKGVTVVGAQGAIARVGTGSDSQITAPQVSGPLSGPTSSPSGLVPVADPGHGSVVIVGSGGAIVDKLASLGCAHPAAPTVFEGKVYVPCSGSGLVLVLGEDGTQAGNPIHTPGGGDPELTVSGGHLLVTAPGAGSATVVDSSGGSHSFPTYDPGSPVQNPNQPPPAPPTPPAPTPPPASSHPNDPNSGGGHNDHSGGDVPGYGGAGHNGAGGNESSSTPPGHQSPSGGPATVAAPGGGTATASVRPDGTVLVSWSGPSVRGGYTVTTDGSTAPVAEVPPNSRSATVTVLAPGTTTALVVHAYRDAADTQPAWTATTGAVTVGSAPAAVTDVHYTAGKVHDGQVTLTVSWSSSAAAGAQTSYTVTASGTSSTVTSATTTAGITVPCSSSCTGTLSVTPRNAAGNGAATTTSFQVSGVAPTPPPGTPTPTHTSSAAPPPPPTTSAAPPPPPAPTPLPTAGETAVSATATAGNENLGTDPTAHVTVTPPADWAAWTDGSCSLIDNGTDADSPVPVSCSASSQTPFDYAEAGTHTYTLRATSSDGRTADSAASNSVTLRYIVTPGCPTTQVANFAAGAPGQRLPECNCPNPSSPCIQPFAALNSSAVAPARPVATVTRTVTAPAQRVASPSPSSGSSEVTLVLAVGGGLGGVLLLLGLGMGIGRRTGRRR